MLRASMSDIVSHCSHHRFFWENDWFFTLSDQGCIDTRIKATSCTSAGNLYNLVGFQTHLKWGEQKRVFSMIPGLENAQFVRYGVMHRNTKILLLSLDSWDKPLRLYRSVISNRSYPYQGMIFQRSEQRHHRNIVFHHLLDDALWAFKTSWLRRP